MNTVYIDGIAFWSPGLPTWDTARAAFRGEGEALAVPAKRPAPQLLAPAERRRATDTVALALEVAGAACAAAQRNPATLPSVFVSAHGDLGVNDYMCSTLASTPTMLSPTRFHNSVHNAPAGYWTMGTSCHEASTALTAFEHSFANGLLAAATQCLADGRTVLLAGYDVAAVGALASVSRSDGLLAMALVLSPERSASTQLQLDWALAAADQLAPAPLRSSAAQALAGNALADALPLAEALAWGAPCPLLRMPLSARQALSLTLSA